MDVHPTKNGINRYLWVLTHTHILYPSAIPFYSHSPVLPNSPRPFFSAKNDQVFIRILGVAAVPRGGGSWPWGPHHKSPRFYQYLDIPGLVNIPKTMERSTMLFMGKSTISMVTFHSYVKLPEGIWIMMLVLPWILEVG